jgi:hypothetical protein
MRQLPAKHKQLTAANTLGEMKEKMHLTPSPIHHLRPVSGRVLSRPTYAEEHFLLCELVVVEGMIEELVSMNERIL